MTLAQMFKEMNQKEKIQPAWVTEKKSYSFILTALENHNLGHCPVPGSCSEAATPEGICFNVGLGFCFGFVGSFKLQVEFWTIHNSSWSYIILN